jgi:hypothetical protein
LKEAATFARLKDVHGAEVKERTFGPGTYVVSLDQPLKRLAKTLLETKTEIRELFLRRGGVESPVAFGVPCWESPEPVVAATKPVDAVPERTGTVVAGPSNVGWMFDAGSTASLAAVADLLGRGIRVRCGTKPFTHAGKAHPRGAFLVRRHENAQGVEAAVTAAAALAGGATAIPVSGGLSLEGVDLGSSAFELLNTPRILLVGGRGRDATAFGSTRYLLDAVWKLPYSVVAEEALTPRVLASATAVVFTEGAGVTKASTKDALRGFMREGGAVVLLGAAAFGSIGKDGFVDVKAFEARAPRRVASRASDGGTRGSRAPASGARIGVPRRTRPGAASRVRLRRRDRRIQRRTRRLRPRRGPVCTRRGSPTRLRSRGTSTTRTKSNFEGSPTSPRFRAAAARPSSSRKTRTSAAVGMR